MLTVVSSSFDVSKLSSFIFDLDGVLWDSNNLHDSAFREVCKHESINPLPYMSIAGMTTPEAWRKILQHDNQDMDAARITLLTSFKRASFLRLAPEAKTRNKELALLQNAFPEVNFSIVTGASRGTLELYLERDGFDHAHFKVTISSDDALESKPSPASYVECMSRMDSQPEETLIFEDSPNGILSALRSGAFVVHILNGELCEDPMHGDNKQIIGCTNSFLDIPMIFGS